MLSSPFDHGSQRLSSSHWIIFSLILLKKTCHFHVSWDCTKHQETVGSASVARCLYVRNATPPKLLLWGTVTKVWKYWCKSIFLLPYILCNFSFILSPLTVFKILFLFWNLKRDHSPSKLMKCSKSKICITNRDHEISKFHMTFLSRLKKSLEISP